VRPSTWAFYREGRRTPGYSLLDFVHGYIYGRWPHAYIGAAIRPKSTPRRMRPIAYFGLWIASRRKGETQAGHNAFADHYHGKVMPLDAAERLVTLDVDVELRGLEQVIPYPAARDIVLKHPDRIVALECPCRSAREIPCLPLDVCLIVGEPFASFIAEHQPEKSRWITQTEATEILRAEHERGHVHHAFFKDAMLGRFYAICNCCPCCCGAMQSFLHGTPMLASSGYVCRAVETSCVRCGACVKACPFAALEMGETAVRVDEDRCMGCGVCVSKCSREALSLVRDPSKPEPLDVGVQSGKRGTRTPVPSAAVPTTSG
jgi:Pyruvate/2-oxoacid:ferredoxin oxidoreductase delta subunit